jgi:glycosyltransferase involved in cell wall biosynthesis
MLNSEYSVNPDISVIIPTFRRPEQLSDAIASVLSQSGVSIEVFVIDDSPEGSAQEIVNGIQDARVQYLKNPEPTSGFPSAVRNLGWPLAHGAFVHFLDDDDIVPEGHYAVVKAAFLKHRDVGVVFGRIEPFGNAPEVQMCHERLFFRNAARRASVCHRFGPRLAFTARMLFDRTLLVCGAAVVRLECVQSLGGFDPQIRLGEDVDFFGRAMRQFGAHFMNRVTLKYRIGSPSLMHAPKLSERERQQLREGIRRMHAKYRAERGAVEFYAMKIFLRLILPCISIMKSRNV